MAGNLKKFVNPRFLKTIDPMLMRQLFERHFAGGAAPVAFDDENADLRGLLAEYFDQPVNDWSEGLVADLHRIAELGTSHGLDTILSAARRQQITLFEPTDEKQTAGRDGRSRSIINLSHLPASPCRATYGAIVE